MVFNSFIFVLFFVIVYVVYWSLSRAPGGLRLQNRFLLFASYVFYGWWDWFFLILILISTLVDYLMGLWIEGAGEGRRRRVFLWTSVALNLGILGVFKYFDFFAGSFVSAARAFDPGAFPDAETSIFLRVILPVGISFYTFQSMAYTIDVYRRQIPAERNFLDFALFVTFFPQLVAGPIERAGDLLPQLKAPRKFSWDDQRNGVWFILLGFFLKTYVADSIGPLVNQVYLNGPAEYRANPAAVAGHGGAQVLFASIGFAFQIYCDFAGYSTIALGSASLLGVRLTMNFETPQFSQNPAELWRRWHSTLNRWVTDYVYIPLGGSRYGVWNKYRNLLLAFFLTGLWHGANWTFVAWGLFMGFWIAGYDLTRARLPRMPETWPVWLRGGVRGLKMAAVFGVFGLSATFFRAYDIQHSYELWKSMLSLPWNLSDEIRGVKPALIYGLEIFQKAGLLMILDYMWYRKNDALWIFQQKTLVRAVVYAILFYFIIFKGSFGKEVIYFAF